MLKIKPRKKVQARLREVQLQLSDLQSQQLPKDHELSNLQHERDALVNKVAFLEEDAVRRAEQHVGSLVIR
jgi:peptidoglycan hydrolase CwlO-like protein